MLCCSIIVRSSSAGVACFETGYRTFCSAHACRDHVLREAGSQARRKHFVHDGVFDFKRLVRRSKSTAPERLLQECPVLMLNWLILQLSHLLPPSIARVRAGFHDPASAAIF